MNIIAKRIAADNSQAFFEIENGEIEMLIDRCKHAAPFEFSLIFEKIIELTGWRNCTLRAGAFKIIVKDKIWKCIKNGRVICSRDVDDMNYHYAPPEAERLEVLEKDVKKLAEWCSSLSGRIDTLIELFKNGGKQS